MLPPHLQPLRIVDLAASELTVGLEGGYDVLSFTRVRDGGFHGAAVYDQARPVEPHQTDKTPRQVLVATRDRDEGVVVLGRLEDKLAMFSVGVVVNVVLVNRCGGLGR